MGLKTMDADGRSPDKTRLCPSCRMEISVLATLCRFCGQEVGRPKDEQRQFTVDDLGGENIEHHSPSDSIMDALEAFRNEEMLRKNVPEKKSSIFSRKPSSPVSKKDETLPDLDDYSQELASLSKGNRAFNRGKGKGPTRSSYMGMIWMRRILWTMAIVAAAILLYFGGMQVAAIIQNRDAVTPMAVFEPENLARSMLEQDGPLVATLDEAVSHYRQFPSDENEAILERARNRVDQALQAHLHSVPFSTRALTEANTLVNEAHGVDPGRFDALKEEVAREIQLHNLRLTNTDLNASPPTATIRLRNEDNSTVERILVEGDTFHGDRFRLELIKRDEILFVDTVRGNRRLRLSAVHGLMPA